METLLELDDVLKRLSAGHPRRLFGEAMERPPEERAACRQKLSALQPRA